MIQIDFLTGCQLVNAIVILFGCGRESAKSKLVDQPGDLNAMAALGTTLILVDNNFAEGINLLKKSRIANYQEIGELEEQSDESPERMFTLASHWWTVSEKMPISLGDLAKRRAIEIYKGCVDKLRGVNKAVAEKRLREHVTNEDGFFPIRIDLIGPTVPRRIHFCDVNQEENKFFLRSQGPSFVQFELPYSDRYDLEFRFSRYRIEWGIGFFFHLSGKQYVWGFAGTKIGTLGFSGAKTAAEDDIGVSKKILTEGPHVVVLKIRPDRLEATLDGNLDNFVDNPLEQKYVRLGGNPPEFLRPYYGILDWWGDSTFDLAVLTQYW
jgi:hypothetical protein